MVQVDMARWRPHLRAAKRAGLSLSRYAHEHGLSRHTLYAALRAERDRRGASVKAAKARPAPRRRSKAAFVAVRIAGARLTVRFPSGVALECHEVEGARLSELIAALAALPCSG